MFAITERQLNPEVRNEIVRDLVTHIYGHMEKPNVALVTKVAKLLVEKYQFMADSITSSGSTTYVMQIVLISLLFIICFDYRDPG